MENELKPKELSKDLVHTMHKDQDPQTKHSGALQVLGIKADNSFMTLSDGYSHVEAALFKSVRPKVETLGIQARDIVYVTLLLHKGNIDVVTNFEKLYTGVEKVIGTPIPYASYLERECVNPEGSVLIPRIHWDPPKPKSAPAAGGNSGPISSMPKASIVGSDDEVQKISLLTTSNTEFLIKGKVTKKSTRKEFPSGKGKGSVFDIVIADDSDEIKCSFFNTSCDKYFDLMEVGKVYIFSNGEVRKGGKFNNTTNQYEIYFNSKTDIAECPSDSFKTIQKFKFKKIGEIMKENNFSQVDLAGVVSFVGEHKDIMLKTGAVKPKQTFKIRDDSNYEIEVTCWGDIENQDKLKEGDTVIMTSLTVGEFNKAKVLNSVKDSTKITPNPDNTLPRVADLNKWKEAGQDQVKSLKSERKAREFLVISIAQLKKETEFISDDSGAKNSYLISAYVASFGQSFSYQKCPYADCYKKATQETDHNGKMVTLCQAHGQLEQPPVPKYIGNIRIVDHTDQCFVNFNSDHTGAIIFGCDASEINEKAQNKEELNEHLKKRSGLKFTFKVYVKFENYQGQSKQKFVIQNCYDQIGNRLMYENKSLLSTIAKLQESLI
jgi:replication factor A1